MSTQATVRQLAGSIPQPYANARAVTKVGSSLFVLDEHAVDRVELALPSAFSFLAGQRQSPGSSDGTAEGARFRGPRGLTSDGTYLYVADTLNHTIRRVVIATGEVTTLAGRAGQPGSLDGVGGEARFKKPYGVALQGGHLWITDSGNKTVRRLEMPTGTVTTVAGQPGQAGTADGVGPAARFLAPYGVTTNGVKLFLTDRHRVRRFDPETARVTAVTSVDPNYTLTGVTFTGGHLYVINPEHYKGDDFFASMVRKVSPLTGAVTRFGFTLSFSKGITSDATSLFVAEKLLLTQRALDTRARSLAGGIGAQGTADGITGDARFAHPTGIASDGAALYVADPAKDAVRKVLIDTGEVTTLATGIVDPLGLTVDGPDLLVAQGNRLLRVTMATGAITEVAVMGRQVLDVASTAEAVYVTNDDCAVYEFEKATGMVSVLAGMPGSCGSTDGVGSGARLAGLDGATIHGGDLYVTNVTSIRRIEAGTGQVTTVASGIANLEGVEAVTSDGVNLYAVAGWTMESIIRIDPTTGAVTTVMSDLNPLPLTYSPTLARDTRIWVGTSIQDVVADQGKLFFTNVTGVAAISEP